MLGLTFAGIPATLAGALMISPARAPIRTPPRACVPGTRSTLKIAATTDVHRHVRGWDYCTNRADGDGCLAPAASIVDSLRGSDPAGVVLVDAGDIVQRSPFAYVAPLVHFTRNLTP